MRRASEEKGKRKGRQNIKRGMENKEDKVKEIRRKAKGKSKVKGRTR